MHTHTHTHTHTHSTHSFAHTHTHTCTHTHIHTHTHSTHLLPKNKDIRITKTGSFVDPATNAVLYPVINDDLACHMGHAT